METNAETNLEVKFNFEIPYNHPVLAGDRKKTKFLYVIGLFAAAIAVAQVGIYVHNYGGDDTVAYIFLGVAAVLAVCMVLPFVLMRSRPQDAERMIKYTFLEDSMEVIQDDSKIGGKVKNLKNCLYRKYSNKQYVRCVFECPDKIQIRVLTGHTNGAPTYSDYSIPKDIFAADEIDRFKQFLQDKVGKDYKIKKK